MRSTRVRPRARACQTGVTRWEARGAPAQARRVHWAMLPPCYMFEILKAQQWKHRCVQVYISHPGGWQLRGAAPHLEGQPTLSQCPLCAHTHPPVAHGSSTGSCPPLRRRAAALPPARSGHRAALSQRTPRSWGRKGQR